MTHRASVAIEVPLRTWSELERFFSRELPGVGLFLPMDAPPAIGSVLALVVVAPDGARLQLQTEVTDHRAAQDQRRGGAQVVFAPIPAAAQQVIARWLGQARGGSHAETPAPPGTDARRASAGSELGQVRARLDALATMLAATDPFAALGVPSQADPAAVDRRYAELVAACHPHHFARHGDADLKRRATEVFVAMQKAYRRAMELARAREPETDDASPAVISSADPVQRAISEALQCLDLCQYDAARTAVEAALAHDRDNTRLRAMFCVVEARRLRADNQVDAALRVYRAVLEYEPEHAEALRAIEELEIKRDQQGGLLRRLFRGGAG